jgi:hypothetical protein
MLRPLWLFYPFFFINGLVSGLSLYLLLRPTSDWLERLFGVFWPICAVELWRVRGYRRTMFFGALMMLFILIPYTMSSGTILEYVRAYISWHDLEYLWLLMLLPVFFMVPLACAIVGLGALAGLMLLPFGIRFATAGVSLQLSAEVTPPGNWEVLQLPCAKITLEGEARLRHETHSDPRAIAAIGEWLSAQL